MAAGGEAGAPPASCILAPKKPHPKPELPAGEGVCTQAGFSTREENLCFSQGDSRSKLLSRRSRREEAGFRGTGSGLCLTELSTISYEVIFLIFHTRTSSRS